MFCSIIHGLSDPFEFLLIIKQTARFWSGENASETKHVSFSPQLLSKFPHPQPLRHF